MPSAAEPVARLGAGGLLALWLHHSLPTVIALTGGIVVAVGLFDVLPESLEALDDPQAVAALVGAGFLGWFLIERLLVLHHRDAPEEARAHEQVGTLGAPGLSIHSFIDGLGIGLAFGLDTATGMLVFIAVAAHDFADGLNAVSFVLSQSGGRRWWRPGR
jgi:ZIP family zinc transporter